MYNLVITVETFLSSLQGGTLVPTRPHLLTGVECLGEEASSQGMVVHSCKQLIEEARVIWKEKMPSCSFLFSSQFIQNAQGKDDGYLLVFTLYLVTSCTLCSSFS